jgi:hypothetical protein
MMPTTSYLGRPHALPMLPIQSYLPFNKTLHASPRKHTLEGSLFPFPGNDLRERFGALLARADAWMLRSMGVPENWREQALWKARAPDEAVVGGGAG